MAGSPISLPPRHPRSRLVDDEPATLGPIVDEATRNAELGRDLGQVVAPIPASLSQLTVAKGNLASKVICPETDHDRVRERPGLAAEVVDVSKLDTDLFAHLAADGILQRF